MRLAPGMPIVVLTGAGISAESGLLTFRDGGGLWENHRVEDVATPEAFRRNPALVHAFYNQRRAQLGQVKPNAAHEALARLEAEWPSEVLVVTQNVDDLHERGGSRNLIHMHGELLKVRCVHCSSVRKETLAIGVDTVCQSCGRAGGMRPHIVWFGEMPMEMMRIQEALERCGLFVAVGTSGNVYPAAGFVEWVPAWTHTLEVNLEASAVSSQFFECRQGPASVRVPEVVEELLAGLP